MRNPNSIDKEEAIKTLQRYERDNQCRQTDRAVAWAVCSTYEGLQLIQAIAQETGNNKLASIAKTVSEIEAEIAEIGGRCYKKVTPRQIDILADALLNKYGTGRSIIKAGWQATDDEMDGIGETHAYEKNGEIMYCKQITKAEADELLKVKDAGNYPFPKVNHKGLAKIEEILRANHKRGGILNRKNILVWAADIEKSIEAGNGAAFEISQASSIHDVAQAFYLDDECINWMMPKE